MGEHRGSTEAGGSRGPLPGQRGENLGRYLRAVAPFVALLILLLLALAPLRAQEPLEVVGLWGTAQQESEGQKWAIIRFNEDSTWASIMVYVDKDGIHPVAGWPSAVLGRFTITTVMGDRVICLQRNKEQATGIINGPQFQGAHCAPIYRRQEGQHDLLEWSGVTVMRLSDSDEDLKKTIADS